MSRIGKKPIEIPQGVEVKIEGQKVTVKGPLGEEVVNVRPEIAVKVEGNQILLTRVNETKEANALYGLSRTLVANAVHGVKEGFVKNLEIQGVGYRAQMQGTTLNMQLGYSHPVDIVPPAGIGIAAMLVVVLFVLFLDIIVPSETITVYVSQLPSSSYVMLVQ